MLSALPNTRLHLIPLTNSEERWRMQAAGADAQGSTLLAESNPKGNGRWHRLGSRGVTAPPPCWVSNLSAFSSLGFRGDQSGAGAYDAAPC